RNVRPTAIHAYGLRICEPWLKSLNTGFPGVVQVAAGFAGCSSDRSRKEVVSVNSSQARTSRSDLVKWHRKKPAQEPRVSAGCRRVKHLSGPGTCEFCSPARLTR